MRSDGKRFAQTSPNSTGNHTVAQMNWLERDNGNVCSGGYQIYRGVHGFDCWLYGKQSGCLGRRLSTLQAAKELCEKHKAGL